MLVWNRVSLRDGQRPMGYRYILAESNVEAIALAYTALTGMAGHCVWDPYWGWLFVPGG